MIIHLFNSGSVSGPERLVLPALQGLDDVTVVFLVEERLGAKRLAPVRYAESLGLRRNRRHQDRTPT